ncbi:hypothetical protein NQ318_011054 [Aromia moschata]|uniref:Uncharacterized protein n=1 Tax=Aromia moschata TaxID=1265417 RepID=A0AAV8YRL1_9CUCU|nr:hypothetical protein NQ318_011054 [Aromia moschata]
MAVRGMIHYRKVQIIISTITGRHTLETISQIHLMEGRLGQRAVEGKIKIKTSKVTNRRIDPHMVKILLLMITPLSILGSFREEQVGHKECKRSRVLLGQRERRRRVPIRVTRISLLLSQILEDMEAEGANVTTFIYIKERTTRKTLQLYIMVYFYLTFCNNI